MAAVSVLFTQSRRQSHVLGANYQDHLPLYRQSRIFGRAGLAIPDSTLAQWVSVCGGQLQPLVDALRQELLAQLVLHAGETPVYMLKPGNGKTYRACLWSYCSTSMNSTKAVVFDFAESRAGRHAGCRDQPDVVPPLTSPQA